MHYIFDIGGVLIHYSQDDFIKYLSKKYDRPIEDVEQLFTRERLYLVETGQIKAIDYFNNIISKVLPVTYDEWIKCIMDNYNVNPEGMGLLLKLKEKGYPVYILSNQAEYNYIAIKTKFPSLYSICNANFLSFEMGLFKPDVAFYTEVSKKIGVSPSQCVFFDDMEENVNGALKAGMKGIHFLNKKIGNIHQLIDSMEQQ